MLFKANLNGATCTWNNLSPFTVNLQEIEAVLHEFWRGGYLLQSSFQMRPIHILAAKCKEEQCTAAWHRKTYFDWTALTFELRLSEFIWRHYILLKLKELPISEFIHFSLKTHLWQQGQRTDIFQLFSLNYSEMSVTPRHFKPRITKLIIQYYGWALSPHCNAQQRAPPASSKLHFQLESLFATDQKTKKV